MKSIDNSEHNYSMILLPPSKYLVIWLSEDKNEHVELFMKLHVLNWSDHSYMAQNGKEIEEVVGDSIGLYTVNILFKRLH